MQRRVDHAAAGLRAIGLKKGDRVAIYSSSGLEWILSDLAILTAGGVDVPLYENSHPEQLGYILRDSGCKIILLRGQEQLRRLLKIKTRLPESLRHVIYFDELSRPQDCELNFMSLLELEALGMERGDRGELDNVVEGLTPDDLLTIIYTSGTTGVPKGVMLSHGNIIANSEATARAVPIHSQDTLLSFLPLSHAFERMAGYYVPLLFGGAQVYYSTNIGRFAQSLLQIKPSLVTGVPRIYEKIYARFKSLREQSSPLQQRLMNRALAVGLKVSQLRQEGRKPGKLLTLEHRLAEQRFFSQLRERMGGRLRFMISGGAPLDPEIAEFFHAVGILILEGYGLSECSPVLSVNRLDSYRFGTVGLPLDNLRLRLAEDGEILAKGPNVMQGYFNLPKETEEVLKDGWLCTGDIGHFEEGGFLKITDRKKDLFKTAGGKYIAPQLLERLLSKSSFIDQVFVVGDRHPYCVALIVPAFPALGRWAQSQGLPHRGPSELIRSVMVQQRIQQEISEINGRLDRHETIKAFHLLTEPFSQQNQMLTSSLKLRRRALTQLYSAEIAALYSQKRQQEWHR